MIPSSPLSNGQQIVISGVGGQGVLFVTRLLAGAAINKGIPVLTSETHGMAKRGGTVISHLKVGNFSSPLIRPFHADGLLALKAEGLAQHGSFLSPDGWGVVNSSIAGEASGNMFYADADRAANTMGNPKSVNLVLLGFALAVLSEPENLFCGMDDIKKGLYNRLSGKKEMLEGAIKALEAGYSLA